MSQHDERIERLITRRLDGELTAEERLELDRELLRSPETRRRLEEHERIDTAAAAALAAVVDAGADTTPTCVPAVGRRRGYSRSWWALPAAAAAAVALIAILVPPRTGEREMAISPPEEAQSGTIASPERVAERRVEPGVLQATYGPDRLDRAVDQDSLYIVGDDGRVYIIDRQRVRTARKPNVNSAIRRVSGDL
ncbi:MAG: hypothetical protein ACYSVY_14075 [Planctomycetota bacterium]|jgi:anti-sigma factor RsiW